MSYIGQHRSLESVEVLHASTQHRSLESVEVLHSRNYWRLLERYL